MEAPDVRIAPDADGDRPRHRPAWVAAAVLALALLGLNGVWRGAQAVRAAGRGKAALLRAESQVNARQPRPARQDLVEAGAAFRQVRKELRAMGPLLPVARFVPFVRIQTRGVQAFADAGVALSDAGIGLTDSAIAMVQPTDEKVPVSGALDALRSIDASLEKAVKALAVANAKVSSLDGYRLVGPIGSARAELVQAMPRITARAGSADRGLKALLAFAGGSGPRRYLFFSQNPDEVRPTGGFIGTYGLIVADPGQLRLERFGDLDTWQDDHPNAFVPPEKAPSALRFSVPASRQTMFNVNAAPDWRQASMLAADLWKNAGEQPVDGVLSVTPGFLAKVLTVLGSVEIPSFGETVNAANVVQRFDFYTRQVENQSATTVARKDFVTELAQVVMQRLLSAPASQWDLLAGAVGGAFDARDAMLWSADQTVQDAVTERGWDGVLPAAEGDFFYGAEFQYEAKHGRDLRRTYDHEVEMRADGSARVTTTITIRNPDPPSPLNGTSVIYITAYGPQGAVLDASSDRPVAQEAPISGHPAVSWFRGAGPLSEAKLKVVWQVPALATQGKNGTRDLSLRWIALPDHTGDVLNLRVDLPPGWSWQGPAPPATTALDRDLSATWRFAPDR